MKIREFMTKNIITCSQDTTCFEAAKDMLAHDIGSMPVVQNNKLIGVITDRDIVIRCIAANQDPKTTTVAFCMSKNPVTCSPETDAHDAARLMASEQIRRLPVVENGELIGMVALGDLAVIDIHIDEAGNALSDISEQTHVH